MPVPCNLLPACCQLPDLLSALVSASTHPPPHPPRMHPPVQVITASLQERQACMFFCKLGKDRTGLIAALVLAACELSEDEIVADYVR